MDVIAALLSNRTLLANTWAFFVFGYFLFFFMTWLPSYLERKYGLHLDAVGLFTVLPWLAAAVTLWLFGRWSDHLLATTGRLRIARSWLIAGTQFVAAIAIVPVAMTDNLTVAIAGITVAVAASMGANAAYYAVNVDIVPERAATALGIMDFAFAIAGFLAPAITGWVLNMRGSFTDGFLLMAVLALSSVLVVSPSTIPTATAPRRPLRDVAPDRADLRLVLVGDPAGRHPGVRRLLPRHRQAQRRSPRAWYIIYMAGLAVLAAAFGALAAPRHGAAPAGPGRGEPRARLGGALQVSPDPQGSAVSRPTTTDAPPSPRHPLLQVQPDPTTPDRATPAEAFIDSERQRGRQRSAATLKDKTVVAVFGGSTTFDFSPDGRTWTEELERLLGADRFAVLNQARRLLRQPSMLCRRRSTSAASASRRAARCTMSAGTTCAARTCAASIRATRTFICARRSTASSAANSTGAVLFRPCSAWRPACSCSASIPPPRATSRNDQRRADAELEAIFVRNVDTISAINRQRGIKTVWVGQVINPILGDRGSPWVPEATSPWVRWCPTRTCGP